MSRNDHGLSRVYLIRPDAAYHVIDTHTGRAVYRTTYQNRNRARAEANRRDLEYGAVRYTCRVVDTSDVRR